MVKDITDFEELPQGCGRLYVGSLPMDKGRLRVGDAVVEDRVTMAEQAVRGVIRNRCRTERFLDTDRLFFQQQQSGYSEGGIFRHHSEVETAMARTTWIYDPHSGGTKIPDRAKNRIRQRILKHAEAHYAGKYLRIEVRFRSQFCYIDAYTEPQLSDDYNPQLIGVSREHYIERMRNNPMHLCRLRYFGNEDRWSMDFYTYSHEKYEPCVFNDGDWMGTPEQAFDASSVYLSA